MVFCKTKRFPTANQDHRVLPRHSNNFTLPFHRLAVLILRSLNHSMSARFAIPTKQRQPDSIAGPLGDRSRRLIYTLAVIVDLGSLQKPDVSTELPGKEGISLKCNIKMGVLTLNPGFEALTFQSGKRWW